MNDIFERMKAGKLILESDPDYPQLSATFEKGMRIVKELNAECLDRSRCDYFAGPDNRTECHRRRRLGG